MKNYKCFLEKKQKIFKKSWKKMLKHGWSSYDFWKFRPSLSDAHVTLSEMNPSFRGVIWFVDVPLSLFLMYSGKYLPNLWTYNSVNFPIPRMIFYLLFIEMIMIIRYFRFVIWKSLRRAVTRRYRGYDTSHKMATTSCAHSKPWTNEL